MGKLVIFGLAALICLGIFMALWFGKDNTKVEFREVALPDGVGTACIPSHFTTEMEADDTLLAYPESDDITLRLSSISFLKKGSDEHVAKEFVRKKAAEKGYHYLDAGDNGVASYEESSIQDGVPLLIKYWEVGAKNTIVIVSATIDRKRRRSSAVRKTLETVPSILDSLSITKSHKVVVADEKEIEVTEETVGDAPREFVQFGQTEMEWLEDNSKRARQLCLQFGSGGELDPKELDRIFSRWAGDEESEDRDSVANALGAAFGSYLVENHGFRWVVVTDEFGTEYAVRHELGSTMCFPKDSVMKRIEKGETSFFDSLFLVILDHLKQFQPGNE